MPQLGLILLAVDCDSRPNWGKANQAMPGHPAWLGIFRGDGGFSACSGEREFVLLFGQVVAAANCCNHFRDDVCASRCAVSRFARTEFRGQSAVDASVSMRVTGSISAHLSRTFSAASAKIRSAACEASPNPLRRRHFNDHPVLRGGLVIALKSVEALSASSRRHLDRRGIRGSAERLPAVQSPV